MTIAQYFRVLRRQWLVVIVLAALSVGGAAAYTARQVPTYSATTQLFVSVHSTEMADISQMTQGSTFIQQRVKSYADIVSSPRVTELVRGQLGLSTSAEALGAQVSVDSPLDTVLLNISVTDTD